MHFQTAFRTITIVASLASLCANGQDIAVQDSAVTRVTINPALVLESVETLSVHFARETDRDLFHVYAGTHVLNVLRGRIPSFSAGGDPLDANTANIRSGLLGVSGTPMLVVDGVPYSRDMSRMHNLRAFDYEHVAAISSGAGTATFGGTGGNGGIFFTSRSGRGITSPTVEFNSYSSLYLDDGVDRYYNGSVAKSRSIFTNAVAYANDYGNVDTRVSYRYSTSPNYGGHQDGFDRSHGLKINTGWDAGKKFSARLIGDLQRENWWIESPAANQSSAQYNAQEEGTSRLINGNLLLKYQLSKVWSITSSNVYSNGDMSLARRALSSTTLTDQSRSLHNIFLSTDRLILGRSMLTVFAGGQFESFNFGWRAGTVERPFEQRTLSAAGGIHLTFDRMISIDANLRSEKASGSTDETFTSGSAGIAFIPTRLLDIKRETFNARLRGSIARIGNTFRQSYPIYQLNYPILAPTAPGTVLETGVDLGFLDDRISLTANYYHSTADELWSPVLEPELTVVFSYGEYNNSGLEVLVEIIPMRTSKAQLSSRLMFYKRDEKFKPSEQTDEGNSDSYFFRNVPDMEAAFFSKLSYGNFFAFLLLEMRSGADFTPINDPGSLAKVDGSVVRLRDISFGYRLSPGASTIRHATLSLSGRNLWTSAEKGRDFEVLESPFGVSQRSISLSLTISF